MATSELPNPHTPLAFLTPKLAYELEVSRYLLVATCGMFSWDILLNLRNDYRLVMNHAVKIPTIVYFISRIASLAYICSTVVFNVGAVGNCQHLQVALCTCFAVAVPATSLLFYFRAKAVFNQNKTVIALFSFLWIGVVAASLSVPFALKGERIGTTDHCITTECRPFSSVGVIMSTVNDTLTFFAISWRLLETTSYEDTLKGRMRSFFKGKGLPAFSRSLLESGQEYYLITVAGNLLTMGMIVAPSIPPALHGIFTAPNIAISNSMACRIFRDIKFGHINATGSTYTSGVISTLPPFIAARSGYLENTTTGLEDGKELDSEINRIRIVKTTHTVSDSSVVLSESGTESY